MKRSELLKYLATIISAINTNHPVRVAIDGVDASGKTFMANELAEELKLLNKQVIRVSVDGFHNPKEIRYKKGRNSPEGYYFDSFDNKAIIENVLKPLGSIADLRYRKAIFDFKTNSTVDTPTEQASSDAILLMDGVFLFRPELVNYWDFKIFLDVDFKSTIDRASKRDGYYLGSELEIEKKYRERYVPGQKLYFKEAHPKEFADIIINNTDLANPIIVKKSTH
ncbi:MAG: cytidylate kinase family protein [Candidatus Paceibacterota bacterium]